jgi:hypothetical protein
MEGREGGREWEGERRVEENKSEIHFVLSSFFSLSPHTHRHTQTHRHTYTLTKHTQADRQTYSLSL